MPNKHSKRKPKAHTNSQAQDHAEDQNLAHDDEVELASENVAERVVEEQADEAVVNSESEETLHTDAQSHIHSNEGASADSGEEEIKVEFPYSEVVRAYVPKAMEMADKVVTDWKKDGSFMNLGIENPYANMAVSLGLKKAKEIEKKLDEKGVLSAVRMGVEVLKQQVNKKK